MPTYRRWHRAYLVEFEQALIAADKENGRDGDIALPYWDWSDQRLNRVEMFPRILRKHFGELPPGLVPDGSGALSRRGYSQV